MKYHERFRGWEFLIAGKSYLSTGPGWAYDYNYLLEQLKNLSGYEYIPNIGDVVIDVGAGLGEETTIFSDLVGDSGKVFAVEAHPITYEGLRYMIEKNSLSNVIAQNVAFADKNGTMEIEDSDNSLANSIVTATSLKLFKIPSITFDEFLVQHHIDRVSFVKMNVEGAEQLIIHGMVNSLNKIKHIAISCHDFRADNGESEFFRTKRIVIDFLTKNNFRISTRESQVNMIDDYVYAVNSRLDE